MVRTKKLDRQGQPLELALAASSPKGRSIVVLFGQALFVTPLPVIRKSENDMMASAEYSQKHDKLHCHLQLLLPAAAACNLRQRTPASSTRVPYSRTGPVPCDNQP